MKHKYKNFNSSFLDGLVSLVDLKRNVFIDVEDLSLVPFLLSFLKDYFIYFSVGKNDFDDVFGSFLLGRKDVVGVPFVNFKNIGRDSVFLTYHERLFQEAYFKSSILWEDVSVCVYNEEVLDLPVFPSAPVERFVLGLKDVFLYDSLLSFLSKNKYRQVDVLVSPGDFVVRGAVVDVFSFGEKLPFRLNFFDDTLGFYLLSLEGEIISSCSVVSVCGFSNKGGRALSSFIKKDCLLVSFSNKTLSIKNNSLRGGKSEYSSSFSVLDYKDFSVSKRPYSFFTSSFLLNTGCLFGDFCVLPAWFVGDEKKRGLSVLDFDFELVVGDFYVHDLFGVCCYLGLEEVEDEYERVCLKFYDGVLKINVQHLSRLSYFCSSVKGGVVLDSLNKTSGWKRRKNNALKKAKQYVSSLILSYGERLVSKKNPCVYDENIFALFLASFPYKDTVDQKVVWEDVLQDLCSSSAMNRLLCGDVGFGKTEIALRAIFLCAINGKRVLFVSPTTILSQQLFYVCNERLSGFGIKIKEISRLTKNNSNSFDLFLDKKVDVLVGTHSLIKNSSVLKCVDLLIVDEEHRFGVKDKERVFSLNPSVDYLCLSATPIPRSLQFSLSGIRKISTMLSPPVRRKPIVSDVLVFNKKLLESCVLREVLRDGQVYVVDNSVKNVLFLFNFLSNIFSRFGVGFLHGGLSKKEINNVMLLFRDKRVRVLVSTCIIESGIDVSSANTIIINNSHLFGLSQLHQLRGRVGRSSVQAFAYFFVPKTITKKSLSFARLASVQKHSSLGSGYKIALSDLELRGAGSLFGFSQSGSTSVGFDYYTKLIQKVVKKEGVGGGFSVEDLPDVFLGEGFVPVSYMPFEQDRASFYKKLSSCLSLEVFSLLKKSVFKKFGAFPPPLYVLFCSKEVSLLFGNKDVSSVSFSSGRLLVSFSKMYVDGFAVFVKLLSGFFNKHSLKYSFINKKDAFSFSFLVEDFAEAVFFLKLIIKLLYE